MIAPTLTYFSAVWAGEADPLWPHVFLLSVSILAAFTVGAGILLESPKYSEAVHRVATWLVLGGIAIESLCTVFLFVFDERISGAQERTISTQQRTIEQLLRPRRLSAAQKSRIAAAIAPYRLPFRIMFSQDAESWDFAMDIATALKANGWVWQPFPGGVQPLDGERPAAGVTIADHIEIQGTPEQAKLVDALVAAIREPDVIGMTKVRPKLDSRVPMITIIAGTKW